MNDFIMIPGGKTFPAVQHFIVACGVFDGVHSGHRRIIAAARARAQKTGSKVLALSFSPHPKFLLAPGNAPELLISENDRISMLEDAGADCCAFINFTCEVAALSPEEFLNALKNNPYFRTAGICVGKNWRFGKCGAGNRELLEKFCTANRWSLDAVPELELNGEIISSSAIRRAIADGDLERASIMLGRQVQLTGEVVRGFQIAGSKLDAPTANLKISAGILPPDGVYSGQASIDGKEYPAALNIGFAPTFGNALHRTEIHLLGFSGDLYGRSLTVKLHRFLRKEKTFASADELKEQIAVDIAMIKADFHLQND